VLLKNAPPQLEEHAKLDHVSGLTIEIAGLGPDGKFWLRCVAVEQKDAHWITSENLDILTNRIDEGGWIEYFACGQSACWGIKWDDIAGHTFRNNAVPNDFIKAVNAPAKGNVPMWRDLNFVAFGVDNLWVFGARGKAFWSQRLGEVYPGLVKLLQATVSEKGELIRKIKHVALSPVQENIFWIEYHDGKVLCHLPQEWRTQVFEYTQYLHRLPGRERFLKYRGIRSVGPVPGLAGAAGGGAGAALTAIEVAGCCCNVM